MLTRRCSERRFLLRPCKKVEQIYTYCLAVAAERYDIDILWMMVLSNHVHIGVFDRHGNYPAFLRYLNSLSARALNAHWGRWENFWATEPSSMVHLVDAKDELGKMIYSLVNPVESHLVTHVTHWPGPNSLDAQLHDKTLTIKRPRIKRDDRERDFFDPLGNMPVTATLRFCRPPRFRHLTQRQWTDLIRAEIAKEEQRIAAERERLKIGVVGRKAILAQDAFAKPATHEPRGDLNPRVACKNKWRRIEQLRKNLDFQLAYREAFELRRAGDVNVLFPHGTYKFRVLGLVLCEPPPKAPKAPPN
jgi:REP element-mobilizing transposase RayT